VAARSEADRPRRPFEAHRFRRSHLLEGGVAQDHCRGVAWVYRNAAKLDTPEALTRGSGHSSRQLVARGLNHYEHSFTLGG
jgi:hypothetical protein